MGSVPLLKFSVKLTGESNYNPWSVLLQAHFEEIGLWPLVNGSKKRPKSGIEGYVWDTKGKHASTIILNKSERDGADMREFVRNTGSEFREYFVQMQAAKRSRAPLPEQVEDDLVMVEASLAELIQEWRQQQQHLIEHLYAGNHVCSGRQCSYHRIGNVFLCERTGKAHVCDDGCKETVLDADTQLLVCSVSGRCFDRWLTPQEEMEVATGGQLPADDDGTAGAIDDVEPVMGAGRFARLYAIGYSCDNEEQLIRAQRQFGV